MRLWLLLVALAAGTVLPSGCLRSGGTVLGISPATGERQTTAEARSLPPGTTLVVQGELVEKCPVAGCWFILRDPGGTVKVDTKAAGFVVLDVPLHRTLIVGGRTSGTGEGRIIDATGIRY